MSKPLEIIQLNSLYLHFILSNSFLNFFNSAFNYIFRLFFFPDSIFPRSNLFQNPFTKLSQVR